MTNDPVSSAGALAHENQQEPFYYVATVEAPSAVFHSVRAQFLSKSRHNLVLR